MLATAVAAWALVGVAYSNAALRTMSTGDVLSGVGQLFVGIAATVAAIASWLNGRKAKANSADAKTNSAVAVANSAETLASLGPSNGTTIRELVEEVRTFAQYQHDRNHDVLTHLGQISGSTSLLMKVIERLLDKLNES